MKQFIILLAFVATYVCSFGQPMMNPQPGLSPYREHVRMLNNARYIKTSDGAAKTTAGTGPIFDTAKWAHRIDSTWGAGITDAEKLDVFNQYWGQMDSFYACFMQLPAYNWDSIVNAMRTEISGGVSRGRFAGIIGNLMSYINDGHSWFYDYGVNYGSGIYPGRPMMRGESGLFGACITTLNDTIAMVYDVSPGQPFNLQPGDVILGYNGMPWTTLVQLAQQYQLPTNVYKGSSAVATYHRYIQAAGENWYLFDTINIKKCDGSLVNFPTSLMIGKNFTKFCTEQISVPGVNKLTYKQYYTDDRSYSWGVVKGSRVGYVYMYDCGNATGDSLYNIVKRLVEDSLVSGLIIDIRTNFGGGFNAYIKAFNYLNSGFVSWVGYGDRFDPLLRMSLINSPSTWYDLDDTDPNHFDKKIAILTGPGAVSAGDFLPVLFRHNPYVKVFGKSTAGAYGSSGPIPLTYSDYYGGRQEVNFYDVADPLTYLTHVAVPVDSSLWFTKESVCAGVDNMVVTAVNWIEPKLGVKNEKIMRPTVSVYPNPSAEVLNIAIVSTVNETLSIKLCNAIGVTLKTINTPIMSGDQVIKVDIKDLQLPTGSYYIMLQGRTLGSVTKKVMIVH